MSDHCADCRYVKDRGDGRGFGYECRRFPPQVRTNGSGGGSVSEWPNVPGGGWCGEYELSPKIAERQQRDRDREAQRCREADALAKIGPTVEIANLARLVISHGWSDIIKKDDHHPEDVRFADRSLADFMGRNGLFQAVVHISAPLGAIQITSKGLQVRRAVEALEQARADQT